MDKSGVGKTCVCPICFGVFDEGDKLPLIFKECGHTFCRQCIASYVANKGLADVNCFACRRKTALVDGDLEMSQFPINYAILGLLNDEAPTLDESVSETPEVCPHHMLPFNLVCFDKHPMNSRKTLCTRCVLQSHKNCNESLIFEVDKLREKTFLVPLELDVASAAARAKTAIETFFEDMKQRQLVLAQSGFDFVQKEVERIRELSSPTALRSKLSALQAKIDPARNLVVLSHHRHKEVVQYFEGLTRLYSDTGMFRKLMLAELDQVAYGMRDYILAKPSRAEGDFELLTRIQHTDTFISKYFVLPAFKVDHCASVDDFFAEAKRVWNPAAFAQAKLTVVQGQNHRSVEKMRTTITEAFKSTEFHSNVGKLNHSLFKSFNFSFKNFFMKPIGFISVKLSSDFRGAKDEDSPQNPNTVRIRINEVCVTVRT